MKFEKSELFSKLHPWTRHMHSKIRKNLSLGLSFRFFENLSFEFEYFANLLQISKKII